MKLNLPIASLATWLFLFSPQLIQAAMTEISLNTASLQGHPAGPFSLLFQLSDGSGTGDANTTVKVSGIRFGGGSPLSGGPIFLGGATGAVLAGFTLVDSSVINSVSQPFLPGATLSFRVNATGTPDTGGKPDRFTFSILDRSGKPIPTQAGPPADEFLDIIFDSSQPRFQSFASDPGRTPPGGGGGIAIGAPALVTLPVNSPVITNFQLVSQRAAAAGQSYLTYRADLVNSGMALGSLTATLTSLDPFKVRAVPGQDVLFFGPVPANGQVTSSNTFTILTDASMPLDLTMLQFTFLTTAPAVVANLGSDQTVKVGTAVFIDGSNSTNLSGVGSVTYSWMFISRPPGTRAVLTPDSFSTATFLADVPGTYVIALTVSNGVTTSTTNVTITAI